MQKKVSSPVRRVHLIFKTHLDIGFTDLSRRVIRNYFECYVPAAIRVARELRDAGGPERFVWTVGSWLVYEYLEQAAAREIREMESAIMAGDFAWHGLPFTLHTELLPPWLLKSGLGLSKELDARFGRKTISAKMTDVPGHTRGMVAILADAGIQYLHIGVNPASPVPAVPKLSLWAKDFASQGIMLHYQGAYGAEDYIPEIGEVICFAHTGDNHGPQSVEGVREVFRQAKLKYPGAKIVASTLDRFARALLPVKSTLPRLTSEIGDTWIRGGASDSTKIRRFRELCRVCEAAIKADPALTRDKRFKRMTRSLLLIPEHTWGLDEKTHLHDWTHYEKKAFTRARTGARFRKMEASWNEQRHYIAAAVQALENLPLKKTARVQLARVRPKPPNLRGLQALPAAGIARIEGERLQIILDGASGGIRSIRDRRTGREWKSGALPIGGFRYETYAKKDFSRHLKQYIRDMEQHRWWAVPDFSKPGLNPKVPHQWFLPRVRRILTGEGKTRHRFVVEMGMPVQAVRQFGAPAQVFLEGDLSAEKDGDLLLSLTWFEKTASRWPEALWLTFGFQVPDPEGWRMAKLGEWISPLDVVSGGGRSLHAVGEGGVEYRGALGRLTLQSLDAPLISPGRPNVLDFNDQLPDLRLGMHALLQNNLWGTNFRMWDAADGLFRFRLSIKELG